MNTHRHTHEHTRAHTHEHTHTSTHTSTHEHTHTRAHTRTYTVVQAHLHDPLARRLRLDRGGDREGLPFLRLRAHVVGDLLHPRAQALQPLVEHARGLAGVLPGRVCVVEAGCAHARTAAVWRVRDLLGKGPLGGQRALRVCGTRGRRAYNRGPARGPFLA
eukprot:913562-Pyramimonas_sp.AAC.1